MQMSAGLPDFFVWGFSHKNAPLSLREKCALGAGDERGISAALDSFGIKESVLLHTCNRVEIYGAGRIDPEALSEAFARQKGVAADNLKNLFYHAYGAEALAHLMYVAAGLESQMVGETEIFGQVKEAYAASVSERRTGALLNRLFQKSFHAVKEARSQTGISRGQISIGNVAVELGERIFGELAQARVLVLGAG